MSLDQLQTKVHLPLHFPINLLKQFDLYLYYTKNRILFAITTLKQTVIPQHKVTLLYSVSSLAI